MYSLKQYYHYQDVNCSSSLIHDLYKMQPTNCCFTCVQVASAGKPRPWCTGAAPLCKESAVTGKYEQGAQPTWQTTQHHQLQVHVPTQACHVPATTHLQRDGHCTKRSIMSPSCPLRSVTQHPLPLQVYYIIGGRQESPAGGADISPSSSMNILDLASMTLTYQETSGHKQVPGRAGHSALAYNSSHLLIFGGASDLANGTFLNDLQWLSISDYSWSTLAANQPNASNASVPVGREFAAVTLLSTGLLVYDGVARNGTLLTDLWRYDFEDGAWERLQVGAGAGQC